MRLIAIILLISLLMMPASLVYGKSDPELGFPRDIARSPHLLAPIAEMLSGSVWLEVRDTPSLPGPYGRLPDQSAPGANTGIFESNDLTLQGGGAGLVPFREPSAKFSRNVIVTQDLGAYPYQNEPSIAVNPLDRDNIVVGAIDFSFRSLVAYSSFDGGISWEGPETMRPLPREHYAADPVVAFDQNGTAYFSYMSIGTLPVKAAGLVFLADIANIVISKSVDGGLAWSDPILASPGSLISKINKTTGLETINLAFLDKSWMSVGPNPEDLSKDIIYISYTKFHSAFPVTATFPYVGVPQFEVSIELVSSTDGGKTWSDPVTVSPIYSYNYGEMDRAIVQGSMPTSAPDGTLHVAYYDSYPDGPWYGDFSVMVTTSRDGGMTFDKPVAVAPMPELEYRNRPTIFRAWSSSFGYIRADAQGNVYTIFAANPSGDDASDIYFSRSTDEGKTWNDPIRVNDDLTLNNQFFPFIDLSTDGDIHVMWGDMRDDPINTRYHIYYAKSSNEGRSFELNSRVSDSPSNPFQSGIPSFIGDYFGLAVTDGDVYMIWTDSRAGIAGGFNQDIAFARQRPAKGPRIFMSPASGPAGQQVTLQGFDFAANFRTVFIEIDGVLVSTLATNREGRFTTSLFIPAVSEGPHTIRVFDITGNLAESSFFADFGFDTLETKMDKTVDEIEEDIVRLEEKMDQPSLALVQSSNRLNAAALSLDEKIDETSEDVASLSSDLSARIGTVSTLLTAVSVITVLALLVSTACLFLFVRQRRRDG